MGFIAAKMVAYTMHLGPLMLAIFEGQMHKRSKIEPYLLWINHKYETVCVLWNTALTFDNIL